MDEKLDVLAEALSKAKSKFKVAKQSGRNPFFKTAANPQGSLYSTLQDVDEAITAALCAEGFAPITVHPVRVGDEWVAIGVLRHKSGQQIESTVPLFVSKRDMQGFKSALTYAQRMLTVVLTGCVSGEADDDGNATVAPPQQQSRQQDASRQAAAGMTAEAELRRALDDGDEAAATKALAKVKLRAKRKEIDPTVAERAEAAFNKVFEKETANV